MYIIYNRYIYINVCVCVYTPERLRSETRPGRGLSIKTGSYIRVPCTILLLSACVIVSPSKLVASKTVGILDYVYSPTPTNTRDVRK